MATLEEKQIELEELHTLFLQNEVHCMINSDVIAIRGEMGLSVARQISGMVDRKSKAYKVFSFRHGAMASLTSSASTYSNNAKKRLLDLYGEEKIDDNVGHLSQHVNTLYSMDADQIVSIMNCTEMVKGGHVPTYLNLETADYQIMAQKTGIPFEYVVKIINELQNFTVKK